MNHSEFRDKIYSAYWEKHFSDYDWNTTDPDLFKRAALGYQHNFGRHVDKFPAGARVLDVGCGIGHCLWWLRGKDFDVEGVDLDSGQLAQAEKMVPDDVELVAADIFDHLAPAEAEYDIVIANDMIEHLTRSEAIEFAELAYRGLKTGGVLLLKTPNAITPSAGRFYDDLTHERIYTYLSLRQLLRTANFEDVEVTSWESPPLRSPASVVSWVVRRVTWNLYKLRLMLHDFCPPPREVGQNLIAAATKTGEKTE